MLVSLRPPTSSTSPINSSHSPRHPASCLHTNPSIQRHNFPNSATSIFSIDCSPEVGIPTFRMRFGTDVACALPDWVGCDARVAALGCIGVCACSDWEEGEKIVSGLGDGAGHNGRGFVGMDIGTSWIVFTTYCSEAGAQDT